MGLARVLGVGTKSEGIVMLNTEHSYFEAGYRCARARIQKDEARAQFHKNWFNRAHILEKPEDRAYVQHLFNQGYTEAQMDRFSLSRR
jgi:hypothetical protein